VLVISEMMQVESNIIKLSDKGKLLQIGCLEM
jgi:hypothetical protein